jgi:hypothetical protein
LSALSPKVTRSFCVIDSLCFFTLQMVSCCRLVDDALRHLYGFSFGF